MRKMIMKKYISLVAFCVSSFVHGNGFDNLKNIQNRFHALIYQAGDLGATQPAPEVPYIAGLLGNQIDSRSQDAESRYIYETLYDRSAAGGNRKAIAGIDQAKADAFNALSFDDFARYNGYQNSGHSVLGVAAQEIADPVTQSPSSLSSSTLSSASLKPGGDSSAGGGRDTSGMLGQIQAGRKLNKAESSSPKAEAGGGGMGGLLGQIQAGSKLNKVVKSPKTTGGTGALNQELNAGVQLRKAITSSSASSEITSSDVQAVINGEGSSTLLEELSLRLERTEMQNTSYQTYRFDKLKRWFNNRKRASVANSLISLLNAIPSSVEGVEQQLADAISTLLPNKKNDLEHKIRNLAIEKDKLNGPLKISAQREINKTERELELIESDKKLLEELQGILSGANSDPLRLQKLKEFLVTLVAGGQFNKLLEQLRLELVPPPNANIPQGSSGGASVSSVLLAGGVAVSRLSNLANGRAVGDNSPEILAQQKVVKEIENKIAQAYDEENVSEEARLHKELAEQAKTLTLLGDSSGLRKIEGIDEEYLQESAKNVILQEILTKLEGLSSRTEDQNTILLRLQGKFSARNLMAGGGSRVSLAQPQKFAAGGGVNTTAPRLNIVQTGTASSKAMAQSIIQGNQAAGGVGNTPAPGLNIPQRSNQAAGGGGSVATGGAASSERQIVDEMKAIADQGGKYELRIKQYLERLIVGGAEGVSERRSYLDNLLETLGALKSGHYYMEKFVGLPRSKVGTQIDAIISEIKQETAAQRKY